MSSARHVRCSPIWEPLVYSIHLSLTFFTFHWFEIWYFLKQITWLVVTICNKCVFFPQSIKANIVTFVMNVINIIKETGRKSYLNLHWPIFYHALTWELHCCCVISEGFWCNDQFLSQYHLDKGIDCVVARMNSYSEQKMYSSDMKPCNLNDK